MVEVYLEVEKKRYTIYFLDIFISYKSQLKIFIVDVNKHHKFFSRKFHGRNFEARRIFYEKLIFGLVGKGSKMTPDLEKCDFLANTRIFLLISQIIHKKRYIPKFKISTLLKKMRCTKKCTRTLHCKHFSSREGNFASNSFSERNLFLQIKGKENLNEVAKQV